MKNLNPEWNELFSYKKIDDEELQEKFFEITVMDYDKIGRH